MDLNNIEPRSGQVFFCHLDVCLSLVLVTLGVCNFFTQRSMLLHEFYDPYSPYYEDAIHRCMTRQIAYMALDVRIVEVAPRGSTRTLIEVSIREARSCPTDVTIHHIIIYL